MARKTKKESVEKLRQWSESLQTQVSPLTAWERGFEADVVREVRTAMNEKLAALPPETDDAKRCPRCGKDARVRRRNVERTFHSRFGEHTIRRHYHYCERCKAGFFPRDEFLGLPESGDLTDELEARVADFAVTESYADAEARWRVHYPHLPVSQNQFRQVAKRLGKQIEVTQQHLLNSAVLPPEQGAAETLYVMNDGGMVPMREGKWCEVKVGVMFRAEHHTSSREVSRGEITRARYVAVLGNQDEFLEAIRSAYQVENAVRTTNVVWIADGAPHNWLLASRVAPGSIEVLDYIHAVENGMKCARLVLGEHDPLLSSWKQRLEMLLLGDGVESLITELKECAELLPETAREALDDLLRYYQNNRNRMAYAQYVSRGLLIGSGAVESAHRHVIQARMKKAGQHWSARGGRQMARLRAAYRTAGPTRFHAALRGAYRTSTRTAKLTTRRKLDMRFKGLYRA